MSKKDFMDLMTLLHAGIFLVHLQLSCQEPAKYNITEMHFYCLLQLEPLYRGFIKGLLNVQDEALSQLDILARLLSMHNWILLAEEKNSFLIATFFLHLA